MAYKKSWVDPLDLPTRCPVCQDKRTDAAAIAEHNIRASQTGCRRYPV